MSRPPCEYCEPATGHTAGIRNTAMTLSPLKSLLSRNRRFILYCLLGLVGVATDLAVFWLLANLASMHHQAANLASTLCGISVSFALNAVFNFQKRDRPLARFISFAAVGMLGLALSAATLYLLVDRLGMDKNWAKAVCVYVVLVQYNLNRVISFRP